MKITASFVNASPMSSGNCTQTTHSTLIHKNVPNYLTPVQNEFVPIFSSKLSRKTYRQQNNAYPFLLTIVTLSSFSKNKLLAQQKQAVFIIYLGQAFKDGPFHQSKQLQGVRKVFQRFQVCLCKSFLYCREINMYLK